MSIFYDCHLHSSFSADSETPAEAMIQRAISIGLSGMCFTEHLDTDCPPEGPDFCLDLPAYFEKLSALRERFRDVIDIRIGLEFGIQPQCTKLLPALAAQLTLSSLPSISSTARIRITRLFSREHVKRHATSGILMKSVRIWTGTRTLIHSAISTTSCATARTATGNTRTGATPTTSIRSCTG